MAIPEAFHLLTYPFDIVIVHPYITLFVFFLAVILQYSISFFSCLHRINFVRPKSCLVKTSVVFGDQFLFFSDIISKMGSFGITFYHNIYS